MSYVHSPRTASCVPPLGVHLVPGGATVAVFAAHATCVELCLIDVSDGSASIPPDPTVAAPETGVPGSRFVERRIPLKRTTFGVWHDFVPDITAGQLYGFRVHGEWNPQAGHRHNPAKLLVDPYARAITGALDYGQPSYGHVVTDPDSDAGSDPYGPADSTDSLGHVPLSVTVAPTDPCTLHERNERKPCIAWEQTVIYEAHVKGLTYEHPDIPEDIRGTYAALGHPALIAHLKGLEITSLELLPIHSFTSEPHLIDKGLTNYWGYNTLGFFAPHEAYASAAARAAGPQAVIDEVRGAVDALHEAGIEVILDVVYNHTAEGGVGGQHLSFKGLDNASYYLHDGATPAQYADVTGCGNSLDFRRPKVVQLTLDSMRYWLQEIGVDGFRMDLAVTLGRDHDGFNPDHPFLVALQTDPVISHAKIIAEPWDVGPGGWQTGNFPVGTHEWNDRFRNSVRDFWLSDAKAASHGNSGSGIRELATRLSGSADMFGHSEPPLMRGPLASINFVTAHDGFTIADLVSYDHKHNQANGEESRDGTNDNRSWNHGVEGPLAQEDMWHVIAPMRRRSMRNLLATLILSSGVPMITAGDEVGRTQLGNNNAYCQDSQISWFNWEFNRWRQELLETTTFLLELRRLLPALRVDEFFTGKPLPHDEDHQPDLAWYNESGTRLTIEEWNNPATRTFSMFRRGRIAEGSQSSDPHVLLVFNGQLNSTTMRLPVKDNSTRTWRLAWDSEWDTPQKQPGSTPLDAGADIELEALSLQVYLADAPGLG